MKWVLLLVWVWGAEVNTEAIEVDSRALCETQAANLIERYRAARPDRSFEAVCIQKSR